MVAARPSVSFVVPALNEEPYIASVLETIRQAVALAGITEYEVVMVDDGSTDRTGAIMDELAARDPRIRVLHNPRNLGLGSAYRRGMVVARCDYVMMVVGDDVMPAPDIALVLDRLGETDIVFAHLTNPALRTLGRRVGSRGFTAVVNALFGLHMQYYQAMVPRRKLIQQVAITTDSYAFAAEAGVKLLKAGCSYVEVGIPRTPSKLDNSVALQPKRLLSVLRAIIALGREIRRPGAIPSLER